METLEKIFATHLKHITTSTTFTILKMFLLGLGLYYLDMALYGKLAINYLNQRGCHPQLPMITLNDINISNFVTEDFNINFEELKKDKYRKDVLDAWDIQAKGDLSKGKEVLPDSVLFGDDKVKVTLIPSIPYSVPIRTIFLRVFGGVLDASNILNTCTINNLSITQQTDDLILHFCSHGKNTKSMDAFRAIFENFTSTEKELIVHLLISCDFSAVIESDEQKYSIFELLILWSKKDFWKLLDTEDGKKCRRLIPEDVWLAISNKLLKKEKHIADFTFESGFKWDFSNWREVLHQLLNNCYQDEVNIKCINKSLDDCPWGYAQYGALTLITILFPGILFAISEFCFHKFFPFGGYMTSKCLGKNWPFFVKCSVMPFYAICMSIVFIIITTAG